MRQNKADEIHLVCSSTGRAHAGRENKMKMKLRRRKKVVGSGVLCESFSAIIETEGPHSLREIYISTKGDFSPPKFLVL